jgi:adenylate cyclase
MAVRTNPRFSIPWILRAAALAKAGRIDEAKASAQRVLDLEPEFTISWLLASNFTGPERAALFGDALRQAGLPE